MPIEKRYLGDSVYADYKRGMVRLTTENGVCVSNEIWLEANVMAGLLKYVEDIREANRKEHDAETDQG